MPNNFGFHHTVRTNNRSEHSVGAGGTAGGRHFKAPIGVADIIEKLSRGPTHLNDQQIGAVEMLGIEVSTGANGYASAHDKIVMTDWYELPRQPTAPERPVPTVTLPWPKRR